MSENRKGPSGSFPPFSDLRKVCSPAACLRIRTFAPSCALTRNHRRDVLAMAALARPGLWNREVARKSGPARRPEQARGRGGDRYYREI